MHKRSIKSFAARQGKITPGQKNAMQKLSSKYIINYQESLIDLDVIFARTNPKIIEIGFGMGHATWQIAKNNSGHDYLGIEVHTPGVGSLMMFAEANILNNLRIIKYDAVAVLNNMIPDNSISGIHIYFPDPWPKTRHHKRRIIQTEFVNILCKKLTGNGYLHLATDWKDYALWMIDILSQSPKLANTANNGNFIPRPEHRPLTKFEQRGLDLGHRVWDIMFTKIEENNV